MDTDLRPKHQNQHRHQRDISGLHIIGRHSTFCYNYRGTHGPLQSKFIKQNLGASEAGGVGPTDEVEALRAEMAGLQQKHDLLVKENKELRQKVGREVAVS
ncbi:hypothetical protein CRUP_019834 [Coryphaenoides rupestris]|nr:hypothetical protein CRUP_019834 [Coryphaenoides rupestris]